MINKRIFGSDIPIMVKKKLEARQLVAEGGKKPGESITSQYPDSRASKYKYKELITSDFNMEGDLSSRTPFVRLWTAVSLVKTLDEDSKSEDQKTATQDEKDRGYKVIGQQVYAIGTNNLSTIDSIKPGQGTSDTNYSLFPKEHGIPLDKNKFMKPQAGITGLSSETGGVLGSIKTTEVKFKVFNFADYDRIYNKYFLKPGAQLFVDFGWSSLNEPLYDPADILDDSDGVGTNRKLYGEKDKDPKVKDDGFVTKNAGDCESLVGIVTSYDSKINADGSVDCTVELTSKNSAMMLSPKLPTKNQDRTNAKFVHELDKIVRFEAVFNLSTSKDRELILSKLDKADADTSARTLVEFEDAIQDIAYRSFGSSNYTPTTMALEAGVFLAGDDSISSDQFISWGWLEDNIFNKYFGHGDSVEDISAEDKDKFQISLNSSKSFTAYFDEYIEKQGASLESVPDAVVPQYWDRSWQSTTAGGARGGGKSGLSMKERAKEMYENGYIESKKEFNQKIKELNKSWNSHVKALKSSTPPGDKYWNGAGGKYFISDFDKQKGRVPLREIFININVVTKAFTDEDLKTMREVINAILEKVNEESYGVWNWALGNDGDDNTLAVIDKNYMGIVEKQSADKFQEIFIFNVMSKNSIIRNYDVTLEMPDGEIGSMYAIQAMSGTNKKMYPISNAVESQTALQSLLSDVGGTQDNIKFRYLPDLAPYNAMQQNEDALGDPFKDLYRTSATAIKSKPDTQSKSFGHLLSANSVFNSHIGKNPPKDDTAAIEAKQKRIEEENAQMARDDGAIIFETYDDMYKYQITGVYAQSGWDKPMPLPMKLSLTLYGISTLKPGDIFKVDYLPQVYLKRVYFQIMKVSHEVGSDGWYTSLETQFRIRPDESTKNHLLMKLDDGFETTDASGNPYVDAATSLVKKKVVKKKEVKKAISVEKIKDLGINDSAAYRWDSDNYTFTTWTDNYKKSSYHVPSESTLGTTYSNSDWSWEDNSVLYLKKKITSWAGSSTRDSTQQGQAGKWWPKGRKIIVLPNIKSLYQYVDAATLEDIPLQKNGFKKIEKLFKFRIKTDGTSLLFIHNPMYYWDDDLETTANRYNGYGYSRVFARNYDSSTPKTYGYVKGIYVPGENVWLGIRNLNHSQTHWFVAPAASQHIGATYTGLSLSRLKSVYDINSYDSRWRESEVNRDRMNPQKFGG